VVEVTLIGSNKVKHVQYRFAEWLVPQHQLNLNLQPRPFSTAMNPEEFTPSSLVIRILMMTMFYV
jgi:hypothetical protein